MSCVSFVLFWCVLFLPQVSFVSRDLFVLFGLLVLLCLLWLLRMYALLDLCVSFRVPWFGCLCRLSCFCVM